LPGSIARASEQLRLALPAISAQLRRFEENLGEKLLLRSPRGVQATEIGQVVKRYADDRFFSPFLIEDSAMMDDCQAAALVGATDPSTGSAGHALIRHYYPILDLRLPSSGFGAVQARVAVFTFQYVA
jgi:DNA-binding transcriptional LysR family regulator